MNEMPKPCPMICLSTYYYTLPTLACWIFLEFKKGILGCVVVACIQMFSRVQAQRVCDGRTSFPLPPLTSVAHHQGEQRSVGEKQRLHTVCSVGYSDPLLMGRRINHLTSAIIGNYTAHFYWNHVSRLLRGKNCIKGDFRNVRNWVSLMTPPIFYIEASVL